MRVNDNFLKLPESYLFSQVATRLREFKEAEPTADIIRMDIGDVTLPIARCVTEAMHRAVDDMSRSDTFHGYGPEQGYSFLREAIARTDYKARGIDIHADDIFISDGAKSDLGNIGDIFGPDTIAAVSDPGYPVYVDTTVMGGRAGECGPDGRWSRIVYLDANAENGFKPQVPEKSHADVIYLCSPCNPTGTVFTRRELESWVDYARRHKAVIIYDSAYEAFVTDSEIPRSIYEIPGAKETAIEIRSFSKTAGFTGLRCGYTVVPEELQATDEKEETVSLKKLWLRRQTTKFNGASYIVQRGAEALFTEEGQRAIKENISVYLENARYIRRTMEESGFECYGGEYSPYVWVRGRNGEDSWALFETLLREANVSSTPGSGFGDEGRGYVRLTGFNSPENTRRAMERIRSLAE